MFINKICYTIDNKKVLVINYFGWTYNVIDIKIEGNVTHYIGKPYSIYHGYIQSEPFKEEEIERIKNSPNRFLGMF